jgi:hypothetical protein
MIQIDLLDEWIVEIGLQWAETCNSVKDNSRNQPTYRARLLDRIEPATAHGLAYLVLHRCDRTHDSPVPVRRSAQRIHPSPSRV